MHWRPAPLEQTLHGMADAGLIDARRTARGRPVGLHSSLPWREHKKRK